MEVDTPRLRHEFPPVVVVICRRLVAHSFLSRGFVSGEGK